jgi:hypothetical protein
MAYNSAFAPFGPTYLVTNSPAVQVKAANNVYPSGYRIVNLTASVTRVAWAPQEPGDATVTPVATTPTAAGIANVLTIPANGVGVFSGIPPNAWFITGGSANTVEITPGEGIS